MNSRTRVQSALRFERPDRLPANESPWEQTAAAWYGQGIPRDMSLADYFGFDISMMYLDTSPRFEMKVLQREGGSIAYEDRFGYTITKPDGVSSTMHFQRHVTTDQEVWARIKPRFVASDARDGSARIDDKMYFGHSDHSCPPDVTLQRYQWILDTARAIFDADRPKSQVQVP